MIRRNLVYTSLGEAASKAIIFILFVYLAKRLGPLDYGYFSLAITFYLMGRTLSLNSLDMHGIRLISSLKEKAEISRVLLNINTIRLLFVVAASIALVAAILILYDDPKVRWICIGFTLCFVPSTFISEWFFNGLQLMIYPALGQAGLWFIFLAFVFLAANITETYYYYLPVAFFISVALVALVMQMIIRKFVGRFRYSFDFNETKSIFLDTGYINLVNIFGYLINSVGIFALSFSKNSSELGYYAVALQICAMLIIGGSITYRVTLPHLNTVYRVSESDFIKKVEFVTKFLGFAAVLIIFYLISYGKAFITAFWGAEYLAVVPIISMLSFTIFFGYFMMGFAQGLFILGKDKLLMKIYLFQLAFTSALTAALFKYFGLMGVAAAMSLSYSVGFIVFMVNLCRDRPFEYQHAVKELVSGGLLISAIYWLFNGNIPAVFALIFPVIYFAVCVLLKVLSPSDLWIIFPRRSTGASDLELKTNSERDET
ncbi:MAG: oligosaccharide flippase family protein [Deltaproteobacteria bacterium]|nr:oligosaccharide flippase family protein [Deltaproteobacteria bacterium]